MLITIIKSEIERFRIEESDRYYEERLFSISLNESVSFNDMIGYINKIVDKRSLLQKTIKKFNMSKNNHLKKYFLIIIFLLINVFDNTKSNGMITRDKNDLFGIEQLAKYEAERDSITYEEAFKLLKQFKINKIKTLTTSERGLEFIKKHERYRDEAYKLGDGMITIGYGHAEKKDNSKYKLGDKISREEAEYLFKNDVLWAENGVKRILQRLLDKNPNVEINQNMFDALVSMAFNMGVRGLETTQFMDALAKSNNTLDAAELIKTSRIGKWGGLKKRRKQEYELFVSEPTNKTMS